MTRITVECPNDCQDNPPTHHEIHHTKITELQADEDAILDWLYHGFSECAYCEDRLRLRID